MIDPAVAAATLHAYVRASGALGASALIDEGMVEVVADEPLADDAAPLSLDLAVRKLPPFAVNAATGEVSAPLGALEHLADGVRALAGAFGDRSVALVRFPTTDGETPFALAAREGEGLVVVIGDDQYEMASDWPPPTE